LVGHVVAWVAISYFVLVGSSFVAWVGISYSAFVDSSWVEIYRFAFPLIVASCWIENVWVACCFDAFDRFASCLNLSFGCFVFC